MKYSIDETSLTVCDPEAAGEVCHEIMSKILYIGQ